MNQPKLYKGKYFIVFYDKSDEEFLYSFDNIREILKFQRKPLTDENIKMLNRYIYRALRTPEHFITFLTGKVMRVYIIDAIEEIE